MMGDESIRWIIFEAETSSGETPRVTLRELASIQSRSVYVAPTENEVVAALAETSYDGGVVWVVPDEKIDRYQATPTRAYDLAPIE